MPELRRQIIVYVKKPRSSDLVTMVDGRPMMKNRPARSTAAKGVIWLASLVQVFLAAAIFINIFDPPSLDFGRNAPLSVTEQLLERIVTRIQCVCLLIMTEIAKWAIVSLVDVENV